MFLYLFPLDMLNSLVSPGHAFLILLYFSIFYINWKCYNICYFILISCSLKKRWILFINYVPKHAYYDITSVPWTCFIKGNSCPLDMISSTQVSSISSSGHCYQLIIFWCQRNDNNPEASSNMIWPYLRFWVSPGHALFLINISKTISQLF